MFDTAPEVGTWTHEAYLAVGQQLPGLLSRWDVEPPAARFVQACLAAFYPEQPQTIADATRAMAHRFDGTQVGDYLQLAEALLRGDDGRAMALADAIVRWNEEADPAWLDAAGVAPAQRAGHVLAHGVPEMVPNTN